MIKSIAATTPVWSLVCIISSASFELMANGFSIKTCFPAKMQAFAISLCVWGSVTMATRSILSKRINSFQSEKYFIFSMPDTASGFISAIAVT